MQRYMIFVIDDLSGSGTTDEMVAIDSFNEEMVSNGQLIQACGLVAAINANVIDNRLGAGLESGGPFFTTTEQFSGFWMIQAENDEVARRLAFEGSKACNRKVELRQIL